MKICNLTILSIALCIAADARAQIAGAATTILIPVVASTQSYVTEITVKDASGTSRSINMQFYEAETSATPGPKACAPIATVAYQTKTVTVAGQCPLAAGSHHGFVILNDASVPKEKLFYAYSRVSNPQGIGFSVDGYPIGHIGGGDVAQEVQSVKRKAATASTPAYQSNCFVATLDDPVDYQITVWAGGQHVFSDSLQPYQMKRYLDIIAAAGVATGDYQDVPVGFAKTTPSQYPNTLLAFCTVQDNTSFGADFRIAKTQNAADPSRFQLTCFAAVWGPGDCTSTLQPWAPTIQNATTKIRLITRVYAPDTINCSIVSARSNDLELRFIRDYPYAVVAGGDNQSAFSYSTGPRSSFANGYH
jgi:hypothetical protein